MKLDGKNRIKHQLNDETLKQLRRYHNELKFLEKYDDT